MKLSKVYIITNEAKKLLILSNDRYEKTFFNDNTK